MVTIHNLEVRMDVQGGGDDAAFVRLFSKYIKLWSEAEAKQKHRSRQVAQASAARRPPGGRLMSILSTVTTPFDILKVGLTKAVLVIVKPPNQTNPIIQLCFNPTEYQRSKANTFAEIGIPGLESPPIQYVKGEAEKLTVELLADTSDTLTDVRAAIPILSASS